MKLFSLKKDSKLKSRKLFKIVSEKGKKIANNIFIMRHFFILSKEVNKKNKTKIGIVVSKKIGSSVERNRAKRLIREVFRLNKHLIKDELIIIVYPKSNLKEFSFKDLNIKLIELWNKAGILKDEKTHD